MKLNNRFLAVACASAILPTLLHASVILPVHKSVSHHAQTHGKNRSYDDTTFHDFSTPVTVKNNTDSILVAGDKGVFVDATSQPMQTESCTSSHDTSDCNVIGPGETFTFTTKLDPNSPYYRAFTYWTNLKGSNQIRLAIHTRPETQSSNAGWGCEASTGANYQTTCSPDDSKYTISNLQQTKVVQSKASQASTFAGVNLSGAETGSVSTRRDFYQNIMSSIPSYSDVVDYTNNGANTVRVPIRLGYLYNATNDSTLNNDDYNRYLQAMYDQVQDLLKNKVNVILDLHNYMHKFPLSQYDSGDGSGTVLTTAEMQNVWDLIATKFEPLAIQYPAPQTNNPAYDPAKSQLIYELMNEPSGNMTQTKLIDLTNAAIKSIRNVQDNDQSKAINTILVDGGNWTGFWSWNLYETNGKNSDLITNNSIVDSDNNWAIAMHQYFDGNGAGIYSKKDCIDINDSASTDNVNKNSLQAAFDYINSSYSPTQTNIKIFIDEFGVYTNAATGVTQHCSDALSWFMGNMHHSTNIIGWTSWCAGRNCNVVSQLSPEIWKSNYLDNYK
jgi:hypothetical protein